jgi:flagellar export protein FliJ
MKPFQFALEPLLAMREHQEQMVRERYAKVLRTCEEAAARVQAASVELTASWKTLGEKLAAGVTGDELLRARAWCNVLELRVKERAGALEEARHGVDAVWKELSVATREREALDRFRELRRRAYHRKAQREEQDHLHQLAAELTQPTVAVAVGAAAQLS